MSEDPRYEKQPPTAPPPYSVLYPTGNAQPDTPQYGFCPPSQPQSGLPQPQYQSGYMPNPQPQPVYPTPQSGYPAPQTGYPTALMTQPAAGAQPTVVIMGGCPTCRVGVLEDDFTCLGILCAICFFPIGILCCLAMKEKRCTNCRASF